jgi:periplasmic copper chaperone A
MIRRLQMGLGVLALFMAAGCAPGEQVGITVTDAWARSSTMAERAGAAYLTIHNGGSEADRLVGVTSPTAGTVEMHESTLMDGMMGMAPVEAIEVPAGGVAELKPGGFHIMLIGMTGELKAGDTVQLTLTFEKAGEVQVAAEVRDE